MAWKELNICKFVSVRYRISNLEDRLLSGLSLTEGQIQRDPIYMRRVSSQTYLFLNELGVGHAQYSAELPHHPPFTHPLNKYY